MVRLERLFARRLAFRTAVVLYTLCSVLLNAAQSQDLTSEATLQPHNLRIVYKMVRLERLFAFRTAVELCTLFSVL